MLKNRLTGKDWNLAAPPFDPLELALPLAQKDLCLIQPGDETPLVTADVLCFPTRWRLAKKISCFLAAVHVTVQLYAERLKWLVEPVSRYKSWKYFTRRCWRIWIKS